MAELVNDGNMGGIDIDEVIRYHGFDPSDGIFLESGVDAVYLARLGDDYSAASLKGTNIYRIGDLLANTDLVGYHNAYFDFEEYREVGSSVWNAKPSWRLRKLRPCIGRSLLLTRTTLPQQQRICFGKK